MCKLLLLKTLQEDQIKKIQEYSKRARELLAEHNE